MMDKLIVQYVNKIVNNFQITIYYIKENVLSNVQLVLN